MFHLIPVPRDRFKTLTVDKRQSIREFVSRKKCVFKTGRGFYQLTKPELIQGNKEIVLVDKISGDTFTGSAVRKMLGLPRKMDKKSCLRVDVRIAPRYFEIYYVFVQSTSYNRILMPNTKLLYEVDGWDK